MIKTKRTKKTGFFGLSTLIPNLSIKIKKFVCTPVICHRQSPGCSCADEIEGDVDWPLSILTTLPRSVNIIVYYSKQWNILFMPRFIAVG